MIFYVQNCDCEDLIHGCNGEVLCEEERFYFCSKAKIKVVTTSLSTEATTTTTTTTEISTSTSTTITITTTAKTTSKTTEAATTTTTTTSIETTSYNTTVTTTTTVAVVGTITLEIKFTSSISPDMTAEEIDILLVELDSQIREEFGNDVEITHEIDLSKNLIETIVELSIQMGIEIQNFLDATLFPFLIDLSLDGLTIISDISVFLDGNTLDSMPTTAGLENALGAIGGEILCSKPRDLSGNHELNNVR